MFGQVELHPHISLISSQSRTYHPYSQSTVQGRQYTRGQRLHPTYSESSHVMTKVVDLMLRLNSQLTSNYESRLNELASTSTSLYHGFLRYTTLPSCSPTCVATLGNYRRWSYVATPHLTLPRDYDVTPNHACGILFSVSCKVRLATKSKQGFEFEPEWTSM